MSRPLPIQFPDRAEQIQEDARAFRRLSPDERLFRMLDLIASGETLSAQSPKRDVARRLREQSEADAQRAFKKLFARHGYPCESSANPADGIDRVDADV